MPLLKKIKLVYRKDGARGTESKDEVIDMARAEWQNIQDKFAAMSAEERESMVEHFNSVDGGIGDALFGDDANIDDFENALNGLEEKVQNQFVESWNEAFEEP